MYTHMGKLVIYISFFYCQHKSDNEYLWLKSKRKRENEALLVEKAFRDYISLFLKLGLKLAQSKLSEIMELKSNLYSRDEYQG